MRIPQFFVPSFFDLSALLHKKYDIIVKYRNISTPPNLREIQKTVR